MVPGHFLPNCLLKQSLFYRNFPKPLKLNLLRKKLLKYVVQFEKVLMKHCTSEFEVQIRGGEITSDGLEIIDQLQIDYDIIQFKTRVREMVNGLIRNAANHSRIRELLYVVEDDIFEKLSDIICRIQNKAMKFRRRKNNILCKEKCSSGPMIHNFTSQKIPEELYDLLKTGLKNVPVLKPVCKELKKELEIEAVQVCEKVFFGVYGVYPSVSSFQSFTRSALEIISQCKANSFIIDNLVKFRDEFLEKLPFFLDNLPKNGQTVKSILDIVPAGCIISPSDKNIGVSILPPSWFYDQYQAQIVKGGHEFIDLTEAECLALLQRRITDFKKQCSEFFQNKMIFKA